MELKHITRAEWVAALRSGKYKQGKRALKGQALPRARPVYGPWVRGVTFEEIADEIEALPVRVVDLSLIAPDALAANEASRQTLYAS